MDGDGAAWIVFGNTEVLAKHRREREKMKKPCGVQLFFFFNASEGL